VGGKRKDRNRWSVQDDDNHILPSDIKVFFLLQLEIKRRKKERKKENRF